MFYETQQPGNMFLTHSSNLVAFILGFVAVLFRSDILPHYNSFAAFISNPDTLYFILKSVFSGVIALGVKVVGEMIIHAWKSKKEKGGPK